MMIKYIQNRAWFINFMFENTGMMNDVDLAPFEGLFEIALSKNEHESYNEEILRVQYNKPYLDRLQQKLDPEAKDILLEGIEVILNSLGFAYFTIACDYKRDTFNFQYIESEINGRVSTLMNEHIGDFEKLLDELFAKRILKKSENYYFGVPDVMNNERNHTKLRSYLYNVHVFFIDREDEFLAFKKEHEATATPLAISSQKAFTILDSDWFWLMNSNDFNKKRVEELIYPNFLALTESVLYSNAIFCYSGMLEMIVAKKAIKSSSVRDVINVNNSKMLNIKKMRPFLRPFQIAHIDHHHRFNMEKKYELFQASYNALNTAIKSMDATISQEANRVIQVILLLFTGLTLYSVVNDIISLLNEDVRLGEMSLMNSYILLGVTFIIAIMFLLLRKVSKNI